MTTTLNTKVPTRAEQCDHATALTRSLLGYGVLVGPVYLAVGIAQGLLRDGFDLSRHALSLLANGPWGWVHVVNLTVSGTMVIAAAIGLRRAARDSGGSVWLTRLVAGFGTAMVIAAIFPADPMDGFLGTQAGPPLHPTAYGTVHMIASMIGFICVCAAMLLDARHLGRVGRHVAARLTVAFAVVAMAGMATTNAAGIFGSVLIMFAWLALTSVRAYTSVASH